MNLVVFFNSFFFDSFSIFFTVLYSAIILPTTYTHDHTNVWNSIQYANANSFEHIIQTRQYIPGSAHIFHQSIWSNNNQREKKRIDYEKTIRFQMPFSISSEHKQHTEYMLIYNIFEWAFFHSFFYSKRECEWKMIKFTLFPAIPHR